MSPPLDGIRVLDLTRLLPGAVCTLMLADAGAEIIKIEQPQVGDYSRWYVPRIGDYAAIFHAINRNKASLTLDLKAPQGLDIIEKLVAKADVLVESFRPDVLERLGLAPEHLLGLNPRLVVCRLSGYGQQGDAALEAGHDLNFAGLTGVLAAGQTEVLPIQAIDFGGAYLAAFNIMTALFRRERDGVGQVIDTALIDAGINFMTVARAAAFAQNAPPIPAGDVLTGGLACYRVYRTADDRPMVLAALEPKFWQAFCQLAGRDDLAAQDALTPDAEHQNALKREIAAVFASKSETEWLAILRGHDTCATPIYDVMQAAQQPALQARGQLYSAEGVAHTRLLPHSATQHRPAPILGADTARILAQHGYTAAQVETLRSEGVI